MSEPFEHIPEIFRDDIINAKLIPHRPDDDQDFCSDYITVIQASAGKEGAGLLYVSNFIFFVLFVLSVMGLSFVALTIMLNKKLQSHPQPLIAVICTMEALMSYNALIQVVDPTYVSCYFGLEKVLAFTLFKYDVDDYTQYLQTLCISNKFFFQTFQLSSLLLNLCLCLDLILTIYSPFTPPGRRTKWYYICAFVGPLLLQVMFAENVQKHTCLPDLDNLVTQNVNPIQDQGNLVLAMTLSVYIVVAIFSTVFAYRRLHRPGVSKEVRHLFVKKHFLYVVVFIVIWTIQQSQNYYELFNPNVDEDNAFDASTPARVQQLKAYFKNSHTLDNLGYQLGFRQNMIVKLGFNPNDFNSTEEQDSSQQVFIWLSGIMTFSTGVFLTIARLYEPLFRMLFFQAVYQFWGEIYRPQQGSMEDSQVTDDALSTFLSSSLNVELVYIILKSVTTFAEMNKFNGHNKRPNVLSRMKTGLQQDEQEINWNASQVSIDSQIERECKIERIQKLSQIEIKNVEKWNTAKTTDFIQKKNDMASKNDVADDLRKSQKQWEQKQELEIVQEERKSYLSDQADSGLSGQRPTSSKPAPLNVLDESGVTDKFDFAKNPAGSGSTMQSYMSQFPHETPKSPTNHAPFDVPTTMETEGDGDEGSSMIINEEVTIVEYAPAVFQAIKDMDSITSDMINYSLSTDLNRDSVFKAKESAGKSGSFFFFSFDRRFIIKTMNASELKVFIDCLPKYLKFLRKNPESLIARIYGVFTVVMEDIAPVNLLLMANAAQCGKGIEHVFDLKGSMINREVNMSKDISSSSTLKDQNLLRLSEQEFFLRMQRKDMRHVCEQMLKDIYFLSGFKLMDYSLLLIVETNPAWKADQEKRRGTKKVTKSPVSRNVSVESVKTMNEKEEELAFDNQMANQLLRNDANKLSVSQEKLYRNSQMSKSSNFSTNKLVDDFNTEKSGTRHKYISQCGRYIYHMAIIDYLQAFDFEKQLENLLKVWIYQREEYKISAVNPMMYAQRFYRFMREYVIINQKAQVGQQKRTSFKGSFIAGQAQLLKDYN